MEERFPVVILAAGASRRMGRAKALLDFGGRTCLELVLDACRRAGQGPQVLVLGAEAGAVLAGLRRCPELRVVIHRDHRRGQTSSVKAGLRAIGPQEAGVFVLPVDHPLVETEAFEDLARGFTRGSRRATIRIPVHGGRRGHPLLLAARHRLPILAMDDAVPLNEYVRARSAQVEQVEVRGLGVITGMNDDMEYRRVLALHRLRGEAWRSRV